MLGSAGMLARENTVNDRAFLLALCWGVAVAVPAGAIPPSKVALKGGRIIPVVGDPIENGTVLIEHGLIAAIGEHVEIPYDAMVVEVAGKVVFPGMFDAHSARGLDVRNENAPVTPFLDVYDAIDPSKLYFEDALRDGITSIHVVPANNCVISGLSRVIHPIGLTLDEMTLRGPIALKIGVAPKRNSDRMVQLATLRETFLELADYLENLAEEKYEESLKKKNEEIDVGPEEARKRGKALIQSDDYDDAHRNLVKLTRGELDAFVYCGRAGDVSRAVDLAKKNGFFERMVLVLGSDCYKAVDVVKQSGRPVVLDSDLVHRQRDPVTGDIRETFVPKVFADHGVAFSLLPSSNSSLAERYLNYQAARCVRNGVSRQAGLEAITLNPAKASGVGDLVGSLEVGKVANILVLSGDPLDFNTWVELVYIKGIRAYDRSTDVRLQQLLGDEPAESEEAEGSEPDAAPVDDSASESKEKPQEESKGKPDDTPSDDDEHDDDGDDGDESDDDSDQQEP